MHNHPLSHDDSNILWEEQTEEEDNHKMDIQSNNEDEDDLYVSKVKTRPKKVDNTNKKYLLKKCRKIKTRLGKMKEIIHQERKIIISISFEKP